MNDYSGIQVEYHGIIQDAINRTIIVLSNELYVPLENEIGVAVRKVLAGFQGQISNLLNSFTLQRAHTESHIELLKAIILKERMRLANELESYREKTNNAEVSTELEASLQNFDGLMKQPWFVHARPIRLPRLIDYLVSVGK